uniref:DUF3741 domain-containing protein n=1 Tax=Ananas comosus var. bracteatus TaxID=296719 RepID=A0A6V7QHG8_ANACO|nr:unnamed protein product [Ananas comosus var. bracteatus]
MSLSVREKRPPGGCAGFLFQLVGWNRLLARKKQKHFPRKLLRRSTSRRPPVPRSQQAASDSGRELRGIPERQEEAAAGRRRRRRRRRQRRDAPAGLVARLMGLESMPVAANENPRKPFRKVGNASGWSRKSSSKILMGIVGWRTEIPAWKPVTANAGANVVGKTVLVSRSRRRQHKLPLPSTSPRSLSGGHRARLLQAACKILEPGMRPAAHSKFALANVASSSSHCNAEQASDAALSWISSRNLLPDSLERKTEPALMLDDRGSDRVNPVEIKANAERRVCDSVERKCEIRKDKDQCIVHIKGNNLRPIKKPAVNGIAVAGSKVSTQNNGRGVLNEPAGAEEFGALARNQKNCALTKSDGNGARSETERYGREKSMTRKRRPVSNTHSSNFGMASSALGKQCGRDLMANQRGKAFISSKPANSGCVEREGRKKAGSDAIRRTKKDDVVSFTFGSPMKPSTKPSSYCKMVEKTQGRSRQRIDVSQRKGSVWGAKNESTSSQRMINLSGDELSKLLDQKIRELIPFDKDDLATIGSSSERFMDSVLQELVPSLDTETPKSHQSGHSFSGGSTATCNIHHSCVDFLDYEIFNDHTPDSCKNYMGDSKTGFSAAYLTCDVDQPSPTSILEASFSTDSCSVGSPNDNQD